MKVLKWLLIFFVAFLFSWILIFTFIQEPFKELVSAKILMYTTPKIPIYLYVAGAFAIGLLLGLFTAFYYYIVLQKKVHKTTKELHEVENKLADARRNLERSVVTHASEAASSVSFNPVMTDSNEEAVDEEVPSMENGDTSSSEEKV